MGGRPALSLRSPLKKLIPRSARSSTSRTGHRRPTTPYPWGSVGWNRDGPSNAWASSPLSSVQGLSLVSGVFQVPAEVEGRRDTPCLNEVARSSISGKKWALGHAVQTLTDKSVRRSHEELLSFYGVLREREVYNT
jgi:hypothetical protein